MPRSGLQDHVITLFLVFFAVYLLNKFLFQCTQFSLSAKYCLGADGKKGLTRHQCNSGNSRGDRYIHRKSPVEGLMQSFGRMGMEWWTLIGRSEEIHRELALQQGLERKQFALANEEGKGISSRRDSGSQAQRRDMNSEWMGRLMEHIVKCSLGS